MIAVIMIVVTAAEKWPAAGFSNTPCATTSRNIAVSICKSSFATNTFVSPVRVAARLLTYVAEVNRIRRRLVIKLLTRQMLEGEISYNASNKGSKLHPATMKLRNNVLRIKKNVVVRQSTANGLAEDSHKHGKASECDRKQCECLQIARAR